MTKKIIISLIILVVFIIGCEKKDNIDEFKKEQNNNLSSLVKKIEKNGYKIFYEFEFGNNTYDLNKNTYDYRFQQTKEKREIIYDFSGIIISIKKVDTNDIANSYEFQYFENNEGTKIPEYLFTYENSYSNGKFYGYYYRWSPIRKIEYVQNNKKECVYYIAGNTSNDEMCQGDVLVYSQNFQKKYEEALKDLDLSQSQIENLFKYIKEEKAEKHKIELKNNIEKSTYEDFIKAIKNKKFTLLKGTNEVYLTEDVSSGLEFYGLFKIIYKNNKVERITQKINSFDSEITYDANTENIIIKYDTCIYNFTTKEMLKSDCKESTLDFSSHYYLHYLGFLNELEITNEEFIEFLETYYIAGASSTAINS